LHWIGPSVRRPREGFDFGGAEFAPWVPGATM
jgi:hypothetical protein